jgi:hypothetical protein
LLKYWEFETTLFKTTRGQKFSRIKVYKALAVPILLYGSEILTLRKETKIKTTDINRDENFQKNSRVHPFLLQKE